MFALENNLELKKVTVSSLLTCIYLPSLVTFDAYNDLLYSLGKRSSGFVLVIIFIAELLKVLCLRDTSPNATATKKNKHIKNARDIFKCFIFLLCVMFAYFFGIILFGAPILDCHEETLMLSALLTLLSTFPLVAHVGVDTCLQLLLGVKEYNKGSILEMFVNNALLAVCGGWLGAVVIPLDWNKPWQEWPIPCYLGVFGGYLLSNVLTIMKTIIISAALKYPSLNVIVKCIYKTKV